MDRQKILYAVVGLLVGASSGFIFANSANRQELEALRGEVARAKAGAPAEPPASAAQGSPADAEREARELISRADASPSDMSAQRLAAERAYSFALMSGQSGLLADAARLFRRAHEADPTNYDTLLLLANSHLTLGLASDPKNFLEARGYYLKALRAKPDDVNVHTLLGMTYAFAQPPDTAAAISEYRKALAGDPRHEMAMQNLASTLLTTGERGEAARRIEELARAHPANKSLADLRAKLTGVKDSADGGVGGAKNVGGAKERE